MNSGFMQNTLTRNQSRSIDHRAIHEFGMTGLMLMENAARGCVDFLLSQKVNGPVLLACGKGNNGGDGLAMARMLDNLRVGVQILLCTGPTSLEGDALANFKIVSRSGIPIAAVTQPAEIRNCVAEVQPAWIVDALLGTGASGAPRKLIKPAIDILNGAAGRKLAIDVPSGLDCDTGGTPGEVFYADHTCTFVAPKPGLLHPAEPCVGELHIVGIGAPRILVEAVLGSPADG